MPALSKAHEGQLVELQPESLAKLPVDLALGGAVRDEGVEGVLIHTRVKPAYALFTSTKIDA